MTNVLISIFNFGTKMFIKSGVETLQDENLLASPDSDFSHVGELGRHGEVLVSGTDWGIGGPSSSSGRTSKVLARRSNAMWDMAAEEEAKTLDGNVLTIKSIRLQTEYIGTRETSITLHGVLMYITEDHLGAYFSIYGLVD